MKSALDKIAAGLRDANDWCEKNAVGKLTDAERDAFLRSRGLIK